MSLKMSLLVIFELSALFVDTFTSDNKSSLRNSENLQQPIQMQLTNKQKAFPRLFTTFLKLNLNFGHSEKKRTLIAYVFPKTQTAKDLIR